MRNAGAETSNKTGRMGWSIRLAMVFLAVGWGPLFVADIVRSNSPQLDASYALQHYVLLWMPMAELCTLLAAVVCVVGIIRFLFGRTRVWREK